MVVKIQKYVSINSYLQSNPGYIFLVYISKNIFSLYIKRHFILLHLSISFFAVIHLPKTYHKGVNQGKSLRNKGDWPVCHHTKQGKRIATATKDIAHFTFKNTTCLGCFKYFALVISKHGKILPK